MPSQRRQCGSTGSPQRAHRRQRRRVACGSSRRPSRGRRRDDLIRRTPTGRASRPAPDRDCASCPRPRCAGWRTAARPPPRARGSCARTTRAAGRPRRGPRCVPPGRPRSASGIARIVRTLAVTSSPRAPSPRVAPRTSRPSLVGQRDAEAVDLQLGDVGDRRRRRGRRPCARARRTPAAPLRCRRCRG